MEHRTEALRAPRGRQPGLTAGQRPPSGAPASLSCPREGACLDKEQPAAPSRAASAPPGQGAPVHRDGSQTHSPRADTGRTFTCNVASLSSTTCTSCFFNYEMLYFTEVMLAGGWSLTSKFPPAARCAARRGPVAIQCGRLGIHPGTGSAAVEPGAHTGAQSHRGAQGSRAPALPAPHASAPRVWILAHLRPPAPMTRTPAAQHSWGRGTQHTYRVTAPRVSVSHGRVQAPPVMLSLASAQGRLRRASVHSCLPSEE